MDDEQEVHLKKLEGLVTRFNVCFRLLGKEEDENNNEELIAAWKLILRNHVRKIFDLLKSLKREIAWSLLDDKKERFYQIKVELEPTLTSYKDYEGEEMRKMVNDIILLTDEGFHGFRQSFVNDTYCEDLFQKEIDRYRKENENRLERIYKQDSQDEAFFFPDETQLKNHMLYNRKEKLFNSQFGVVFHNNGRDIKMTVGFILGKKEQTYDNINDFLDKYVSYQIAQEHCEIKKENIFQNMVFKENVDVDKLMLKLKDLIEDNTLSAQKHWFIVYKVFLSKNWLKKSTQRLFVDQINSAFSTLLKCSTDDFHEINGYFKHNDFTEWTLADCAAPSCCEAYREIADKLDLEFQESKYAKPGTFINARKIEKFR